MPCRVFVLERNWCSVSSAFLLSLGLERYAPLIYDAWTHPDTLRIISNIAGVDLIPEIDLEIENINLSVPDDEMAAAESTDSALNDIPVTAWHVDSYPLVCIVMMSNASNMAGGEIALEKGTGEILKVRSPHMVSIVKSALLARAQDTYSSSGLGGHPPGPLYYASGSRRPGPG